MKEWLELNEVKFRKFNKSSWVPLKRQETKKKVGEYGYTGYLEDIDYIISVAVYKNKKEKVEKEFDWTSLSGMEHRGYHDGEKYYPSDIFFDYEGNDLGVFLVLKQEVIREEFKKWYINQDVILSLDLEKEGNDWISPIYGYEKVIREEKNSKGETISIDIKAEYLKDYLSARDMDLYVLTYSERRCVTDEKIIVEKNEKNECYEWNLYDFEIQEGGGVLEDIFVHKVSRTDVSKFDEIPDLSEESTDKNIKSESYIIKPIENRKKILTMSRIWKNEWVVASEKSPKVKRDRENDTVPFKIDESGREIKGQELKECGRWLWFNPNIMNLILSKRGSKLEFLSRETGRLVCSYGVYVYFGVNDIGKVNIYSEEISKLPIWLKKTFSSENITPEGGISKELYKIEILAESVETIPLEEAFKTLYKNLNILFFEKNKIYLFNDHPEIENILKNIHRFTAQDYEGIFKLCKDISKVIIESINLKEIKKLLRDKDETKTIKILEKYISTLIDTSEARDLTKILVGIYELRHGDAHLSGSNIDKAFEFLEINKNEIPLKIGESIILLSCRMMKKIIEIIEK